MKPKTGMLVRMRKTNISRDYKKWEIGLLTKQDTHNHEKHDAWTIYFPQKDRTRAWFSSDEFEVVDDLLKVWREQDVAQRCTD